LLCPPSSRHPKGIWKRYETWLDPWQKPEYKDYRRKCVLVVGVAQEGLGSVP